ncbi:hypothetical protein OMCYN_01316 [cyanobiont of Ornithocercus magnificus]|nr:hypothetical protein OMCYN_01316 [cyanobiont of Ornithocercus magnificus]
MRSLPLKLVPGSDLRLSLQEICREREISGFVLGVVGNLSRAALRCPGQQKPTILEGELEIITLNGTVAPDKVHLHLSLSDSTCQVWGGHLELGTEVLKGADLLLGLLDQPLPQVEGHHTTPAVQSRIEVAVLPGCPWSARALRLLRTLGLPHEVTVVSSDEIFQLMRQRSNMNTFPQIFINGKVIGGYDTLVELHGSGKLRDLALAS